MSQTKTLDEEQAYFDHAHDRREAARQAAKEGGQAGGRYAQIALNKQNRAYLAKLAPPEAPAAHGAILTDDGELFYVGLDTIKDEDQDILVLNWRSPIGGLYERATVQDPEGVALKRTFKTDRNTVKSFEDMVYADLLERVSELTELELSGVDDVLLADLDAAREGTMRDIVRTIQAAQSHLIRHPSNALLVVQGGPGTGKSAVALHRASWLLFNEEGLTPEDVLVVGPNDTFTYYIKDVLPGLGDHNVPHLSLRRLGPHASTRREEPMDTARLKGEARMADLLQRALHQRIRFTGDETELQVGTGARSVQIPRAEVEGQIDQLRESPTYSNGRQGVRAWLINRVRRELDSRGVFESDSTLRQVVETALERVWPALSAQQFIRDLLGSQARLQEAVGDQFTGADIGRLYRRASATAAAETWSDSDVALLDEAEYLINGQTDRFAHIIVDEAQDLSPMQLRSIARRSKTGAMTVVGDIAQSTGPWSRDRWDEVIEALSRDGVPIAEVPLDYGYRVPAEIYELAARLLPWVAPDLEPLTVVRNAPERPRFKMDDGDYDVTEEVLEAISEHTMKGRFIGVVVTPEFKPALAKALTEREITFSDADNGSLGKSLNLVSAAEAKGLEFDAVIVVEPADIAALDRGMRLLYIALTRATKYLTVVHAQAFEPLGLKGAEPLKPISGPIREDGPDEHIFVDGGSIKLPEGAATHALSPALVSAAAHRADEIRGELAPHAYAAFVAEIARQLGVDVT